MDRKRQHYDNEPGQRGGRRSDEYEQRDNKRGRHTEHPAAALPPSLQRRLQWPDQEPQQQEAGPRKQGGMEQRNDPRGSSDRPPPRQGQRDERSYGSRGPSGPPHHQQQRHPKHQQQHLVDSYRPQQQQQQQQGSPRRGNHSAQRDSRQREPQQSLDRQGSRGGVFDRLGEGSERHPSDPPGDQQYASRDGRSGSSSRLRQAGSPGRGGRSQDGGGGGEGRGYGRGQDYDDRARDKSAHSQRDAGWGDVAAAAGAASRPRRSSSPQQRRHSDHSEQRHQPSGRSSSPGMLGRGHRPASESEGRTANRSADRDTPQQRRRSSSHDRSHGQQQQQQQQGPGVAQNGGSVEPPPTTGVSRKSTGSRHTPIVFDLPPPPPVNEGDLLPLRSSGRASDSGHGQSEAADQAGRHDPRQQQERSSSGLRQPHATEGQVQQEQLRSDDRRRHQQDPRGVIEQPRRGEERPVSPGSGRGREAGRGAPVRRMPQLSPEPFNRPAAGHGDRGDSARRGQEVDRSRERSGRNGGEQWQGQVNSSSRDRSQRERSDRGQDDDWSWRPDDVAKQPVQAAVKQPMVVPEAKPQQPTRPAVTSPRAAGQAPAAGNMAASGRGGQPPAQQQRRGAAGVQDAPASTPAAKRQALLQQREARRSAAVQQQLRGMHFSKTLVEPHVWRQLLQAANLPEEAVDSTLATTQRMSVQARRLQDRAGAASLPLPDQAPPSSVLGNAGTEAHLHLLQESIDAYSLTAQQPWCKSLGTRGSLLLGQEFAGLLW